MSTATTLDQAQSSSRYRSERDVTLRSVTVIAGVVIALTFLFAFGNVLDLALRLGVPAFIAPLVAPAVDLSVVGLLVGIRYLTVHGASPVQLRPARRLLLFASAVTLTLNVTDPVIAGRFGRATFDAVGPLLLMGWVVGPTFLQASVATAGSQSDSLRTARHDNYQSRATPPEDTLLEQARREDARYWAEHKRPISAETLRRRLSVGAARSRALVSLVRAERATSPVASSRDSTSMEAPHGADQPG